MFLNLIVRGQVVNDKSRVKLGNSSTDSGSSDLRAGSLYRPELIFSHSCLLYFAYMQKYIRFVLIYLLVLFFNICCTHGQVLGTTLGHELHILHRHACSSSSSSALMTDTQVHVKQNAGLWLWCLSARFWMMNDVFLLCGNSEIFWKLCAYWKFKSKLNLLQFYNSRHSVLRLVINEVSCMTTNNGTITYTLFHFHRSFYTKIREKINKFYIFFQVILLWINDYLKKYDIYLLIFVDLFSPNTLTDTWRYTA